MRSPTSLGVRAPVAGGMLFADCGAAAGAQFIKLRMSALFVGGDAYEADQPACAASTSAVAPLSAQLHLNKVVVNDRLERGPT
jgi:hypothetical protein